VGERGIEVELMGIITFLILLDIPLSFELNANGV
jgi:hypothetical protein